ncbi:MULTISPECIES: restriction endonuclease subunit S [unclassified Streptomyces]|uniref:restriction endonuclease subunit S n=1 Tax=unclassified Streptomyces TaxID=2593676 RepID=UPI00086FA583|nr:restriction endonuclease subunit S [Streptomyces sp. AVP053U2]ODA74117.1 Type-1 restriction enzyme EcoKI specificity protein [Streptomyces sp. AVP053U2]
MTLGLSAAAGDGAEGASGELPAGWVRATVAELCDVNPRGFDEEPEDDDLISQVPMAMVEAGTGRLDASMQVRYGDFKRKSLTRFQENDVLFAKITPCMENGKIAQAQALAGGRALGSTEFHVLRSRGAVLPEYLMHYLLQRSVRMVAEQYMSGAVGQRRVPRPYLESLEIPVPPLEEQLRIVAEVGRQVAHIEAGERAVSLAVERAVDLHASIADGAIEQLSDAPVVKLESVLREPLRNGVSAKATNSGAGIRTLTLTAVTRDDFSDQFTKITGADPKKAKNLWLEDQDIFIQRSNSAELVGTSAIYRGAENWAIYPDLLIRVRVQRDQSLPDYVALVLRTSRVLFYLRQNARGLSGSMPKIDQATIENVEFPLPSLPRQKEAIDWVARQEASLEPILSSINDARNRSTNLRASLLRAAFTGALVPQDPADEPASVLLDRIRAEQKAKPPRKRTARKPRSTPPGQEELPS